MFISGFWEGGPVMKRFDLIPITVIALLVLYACSSLLPYSYLLTLAFLLLICGVLFYFYPIRGSIWASGTLLMLFGLFSLHQLRYFAFTRATEASVYVDPLALLWIMAAAWMVYSSVELLHWAFKVWDRIDGLHKPLPH